MIFFNYEKLYVLSGADSSLIVLYFTNLVRDINMYKDLVGGSFVVNEKVITNNPYRLSNQQLAEYLGILSFRNYANYKFTRDSGLSLEMIPPWIPRDVLQNNPLIEIKSNKIIFNEE